MNVVVNSYSLHPLRYTSCVALRFEVMLWNEIGRLLEVLLLGALVDHGGLVVVTCHEVVEELLVGGIIPWSRQLFSLGLRVGQLVH